MTGSVLEIRSRESTNRSDSSVHPVGMTLEKWSDLPDDVPGELVDGVLVEEEVAGYAHEVLVLHLGQIFREWIVPRGGFVAGSDAKFAVGPERGRKPDLTVFFPGRRPPAWGLIRIPPDIAVEVVSGTARDSRRDCVDKVDEYAAFGISSYWIVDPHLRSVQILQRGDDKCYSEVVGMTGGVARDIPGCPELTLDIDALWAEVDRLG